MCNQAIFINRPQVDFPHLNTKQVITTQTGGIFGFGVSRCETTVYFLKNEFYTGSKAQVRIVCDNSSCDKAVKSFKFKIFRQVALFDQTRKRVLRFQGYVTVMKMNGIAAKSQCDKVFEIDLPQNDYSDYSKEHKFDERIGASYQGRYMSIKFYLHVFVKH